MFEDNKGILTLDYITVEVYYEKIKVITVLLCTLMLIGGCGTKDSDTDAYIQEQDEIMGSLSDMVTYASEWINGVIFSGNKLTDAPLRSSSRPCGIPCMWRRS